MPDENWPKAPYWASDSTPLRSDPASVPDSRLQPNRHLCLFPQSAARNKFVLEFIVFETNQNQCSVWIKEMQALQLSKRTTLIFRALFLAASTTSSSCRSISTMRHFPLSSPSCLTDINHRSDTWPSSTATNLLLRTPWSATQYRGVKAYGSDVTTFSCLNGFFSS